MIYVIAERCNEGGPVKIGYTDGNDPESRIRTLQIGNPRVLVLIARMDGTERDEQRIHLRLARDHHAGEWFSRGPDVVAFIAENACVPVTYTRRSGLRTKPPVATSPRDMNAGRLMTYAAAAARMGLRVPTFRRRAESGSVPAHLLWARPRGEGMRPERFVLTDRFETWLATEPTKETA